MSQEGGSDQKARGAFKSYYVSRLSPQKMFLILEKNIYDRFQCLIPQKNRIEKCRLAEKSVFENIDFCGSYGLKRTKKWPKSGKCTKIV